MDKESFEEFHIRKQYIVVDDIKEEKMEQYMEIAMLIAKRLCKEENRQLLIQVFEEKRIREEYKKELRRILKVSKRKVLELYNAIYNQVENI